MMKLLIVDDEPLVCIGLQSMLDWPSYDIEVAGTARNGQQALEMMEADRPDIVISDVKMPVMDGLALARESYARFGRVPLFILLTNYEEFEYVREAMKLQAVDYLIKIELDARTLADVLRKAIDTLQLLKKEESPPLAPRGNRQALREKFFLRLLYNLFDSEEERQAQLQSLQVDLGRGPLAVASFVISPAEGEGGDERAFSQFSSALRLVRETLSRYFSVCHIVALDLWYLSAVLGGETQKTDARAAYARAAAAHTLRLLNNYLSLSARAGIGHFVNEPQLLSASYQASQHCLRQAGETEPVLAGGAPEEAAAGNNALPAMRELLPEIRRAFSEMDARLLDAELETLSALIASRPGDFLTAADMACNVLYMAISLLPEGGAALQRMLQDFPEGYRSLHHMHHVSEVLEWLQRFRTECCAHLAGQQRSYKRQVIESVKSYINENIDRRLSLQEVASVFNFSPNYLSQLFARHTGEGFVDYITIRKIGAAKDMLRRGEGKVYEIAERLGFDNSFYFSKVFKKVEGVSPREYQQRFKAGPDGDYSGRDHGDA